MITFEVVQMEQTSQTGVSNDCGIVEIIEEGIVPINSSVWTGQTDQIGIWRISKKIEILDCSVN